MKKYSKRESEEICQEARERYKRANEYRDYFSHDMVDDTKFEAGEQWPSALKAERENTLEGPRPCLTFNRIAPAVRDITNDMRQNLPAVEAIPVDDFSDIKTAELITSIQRNARANSQFKQAINNAVRSQVVAGLGYFRIKTVTVNKALNHQEPVYEKIQNPFSVLVDPSHEDFTGKDAEYWFVEQVERRDKLEEKYPKIELTNWDSAQTNQELKLWHEDADTVRVAEYWHYKVIDGVRRVVQKIIAGGETVLEENIFPGKYIPLVQVVGEFRLIDGRPDYRGVVRDARDPQHLHNYVQSTQAEMLGKAPKVPWLIANEAIQGFEEEWARASTSNASHLPYKAFDTAGNPLPPPQRADMIGTNPGLNQAIAQSIDDIKATTSRYDASMGNTSNETSGKAILARQREADTNAFHFADHLGESLVQAAKIILYMIPEIYDSQRVIRIMGEDDTPKFAQINPEMEAPYMEQPDTLGQIQKIFNPTVGLYDIRLVVGPNYQTKRQETAGTLTEILHNSPQLMQFAGDLFFKALDVPEADKIAKRLKRTIPPEVLGDDDDEEGERGPEAAIAAAQEQVMAQVGPQMEEMSAGIEQLQATNEELMMKLQQAEMALNDKSADYQLKAEELAIKRADLEMKGQQEQLKAQADIQVAAINAQSNAQSTEESMQRISQFEQQAYQFSGQMQAMQEQLKQNQELIVQMTAQSEQALRDITAALTSQQMERSRMQELALGLLKDEVSIEAVTSEIERH